MSTPVEFFRLSSEHADTSAALLRTQQHLADAHTENGRLRRRLEETCDDHETCETCGTALCVSCRIGDMADCAERFGIHCANTDCWCGPCLDAAAADNHYEQQAEPTGRRY